MRTQRVGSFQTWSEDNPSPARVHLCAECGQGEMLPAFTQRSAGE